MLFCNSMLEIQIVTRQRSASAGVPFAWYLACVVEYSYPSSAGRSDLTRTDQVYPASAGSRNMSASMGLEVKLEL
jgi:hypothetical protein